MGTTNPEVTFTFTNNSGGTMDIDPRVLRRNGRWNGRQWGTIASNSEIIAALRMKLATRASPATLVTFDLSMADNAPAPCGVFVQAIAST
jgi:hypothetical protein